MSVPQSIKTVSGNITPVLTTPDGAFNYDSVTPEAADYLRQKAADINARRSIAHRLTAEMGAILIEVKAAMPGVFLAWVRSEFEWSEDTAENYMRVARNMPQLVNPEQYQQRALYLLAGNSVTPEARESAAALAGQGVTVDYETAYILASAPEPLRARFAASEITKDNAFHLAKVLNRKNFPPAIRQICLDQKVSTAAAAEYLYTVWDNEQKTAHHVFPRKTFSEIRADNWTLNGYGWSVHISQAGPMDIQRFKADREQMYISEGSQKRYDWISCEARLTFTEDGRVLLVLGENAKVPAHLNDALALVNVRIDRVKS